MTVVPDEEDEIELVVDNLGRALPKSLSAEKVAGLKEHLIELRSTEEELENLERQQKLGYVKDEDYFHRHDQLNLRKNTLIDEIKEHSVGPLVDSIKDPKSKSRIRKIADGVVSYKDALKALAEIGGAAARGFLTGA
jgi:hypothetical protein